MELVFYIVLHVVQKASVSFYSSIRKYIGIAELYSIMNSLMLLSDPSQFSIVSSLNDHKSLRYPYR